MSTEIKTCSICGVILVTTVLVSGPLVPIICRECEFIHQPHTIENIPLSYFETASYAISGVSDLKNTLANFFQFPDDL